MPYTRQNPPPEYDPDWWRRELEHLEQAFGTVQLKELYAEPSRPRTGMVVLADGSSWDPGSGAGFYGYYGGNWVKLG